MAPTSTMQPSKSDSTPTNNHQTLPTSLMKQHPVGAPNAKKISRRSSKPIINWLQRKLAGSIRARRIEPSSSQPRASTNGSGYNDRPLPRASSRTVSAPSPSIHGSSRNQDSQSTARKNTISLLDEDEERRTSPYSRHDDSSSYHYSDNASSRSGREADEDASMRPLPPSSPPSPSPSPSSSSYMSDPRTFRSLAASTKPTTLISLDMNGGGGMAHIAQSTSPTTHLSRLHHGRNNSTHTNPGVMSSGASITFSQLPAASPEPSSRPSSLLSPNAALGSVQAPLHTTHHPRNNPRPSSPPMDNASVLTLASSAFGVSSAGHRIEPSLRSAPLSVMGMSDSMSHIGAGSVVDGESTSQYVMGYDERLDDRDVDASVRALRPRSSRRGSWESEMSRWSARGPLGTPSFARDMSMWTKTEETAMEGDVYRDRDPVTSGSALNHFPPTQIEVDPVTPNMQSSSIPKLDPTDITPGKEQSPPDLTEELASKFAALGRESPSQKPPHDHLPQVATPAENTKSLPSPPPISPTESRPLEDKRDREQSGPHA